MANCIDEAFTFASLGQIDRYNAFDRLGHSFGVDARAEPLAERGSRWVAAKRDLVVLDAGLIEPENADVADMMVAAGIDAAGNLDAELGRSAAAVRVGETPRNRLRDRDRAGGGERAIIQTRAGDDVGDQAGIWLSRVRLPPALAQSAKSRPAGHGAGPDSVMG